MRPKRAGQGSPIEGTDSLKNRTAASDEFGAASTIMEDPPMAKKKPIKASPKSSHGLWDDSWRGELAEVQEPLAQIARPHDPTARNCHGSWQKSRGNVR